MSGPLSDTAFALLHEGRKRIAAVQRDWRNRAEIVLVEAVVLMPGLGAPALAR